MSSYHWLLEYSPSTRRSSGFENLILSWEKLWFRNWTAIIGRPANILCVNYGLGNGRLRFLVELGYGSLIHYHEGCFPPEFAFAVTESLIFNFKFNRFEWVYIFLSHTHENWKPSCLALWKTKSHSDLTSLKECLAHWMFYHPVRS